MYPSTRCTAVGWRAPFGASKGRTYPAQKGDIISEVVDNVLKLSSVIAPDTIIFIPEPVSENSGDNVVHVVETELKLTWGWSRWCSRWQCRGWRPSIYWPAVSVATIAENVFSLTEESWLERERLLALTQKADHMFWGRFSEFWYQASGEPRSHRVVPGDQVGHHLDVRLLGLFHFLVHRLRRCCYDQCLSCFFCPPYSPCPYSSLSLRLIASSNLLLALCV